MSLLRAKNLKAKLGSFCLDVDAEIILNPGEVVGFIGPNGAGKSTLLRAFCGMVPLESGEIHYKDQLIHHMDASRKAKLISYLPQIQEINWMLSVESVVSLGRIPHGGGIERRSAEDRDAIEAAIRETKITDFRERSVGNLSGGERTLVLMARAFATRSSVILADEPAQALDPSHELRLLELMRNKAEQGCGIILVMHHLAFAARFCDRLYLMEKGKIISSGVPREVLTRENLAQVYGITAEICERKNEFSVMPWSLSR